MKVNNIYQSTPGSVASYDDVAGLQQKMVETVEELSRMADDVGMAKNILSYNTDQRKMALARAMKPSLSGGESFAKAEAEGRASEPYAKEMAVLAKQHQVAEQAVMKWEATKIAWETARSILSVQKESMRTL